MRRILFVLSMLMLLSIMVVPIVSAQQDTSQPVHVVRYGETLFSIAVRYNTTVAALAALNDIRNPNLIFVGQVIRIGGPGVVPTPTSPPATQPPPTGETRYTVVRGDTLNRIAQRFGVTLSAIVTRNNLSNPNLIYPGQNLVIPAPGTTPVPPTAVPPTGVPPTQAPPTQQPGGTVHTVQRGESLNAIARRYGVTIAAIVTANNIVNPNLIYPGQRLVIPVGGVVPTPTPPPGTGVPPTAPPSTINPGPGPIGGFELGGHIFSYNFTAQMRRAGMTWAKTQIRWNGTDSAEMARGAIDGARAQGFRVLLSIVGDPAQLAQNPSAYYQSFANFLGGVAALGPDAIEVWNEMNIDREWPRGLISPAAYTQMLSQAFAAIKRANPNVLVISGAPAPTGFFGGACTGNGCDDSAYIRQMASAGAAQYADCIGVHYNEGILPATATSGDPRGNSSHYTRYFPTMVNLYSSVFPNKPLCFTEIGYLTPEGLGQLGPGFAWGAGMTVQRQAEYIAQAASLARQSGRIRLFIVWNVDAPSFTSEDPQAGYAIVRNGQCAACITLGTVMGVQ